MTVGLEERLLDEVGRVHLPLEPPSHLEAGEQPQVVAVEGQQLAEGVTVPGPGEREQSLRRTRSQERSHERSPFETRHGSPVNKAAQ